MRYTVVEVPKAHAGQLEQLGTKPKFWFDANTRLFKAGRQGTGENWAEKVCSEIAHLLGLPHATYDLAIAGGTRGVVTPSFVPQGARLVHGNELIGHVVAGPEMDMRQRRVRFHTVGRIHALLKTFPIQAPLDWTMPAEVRDAFGVFAGYVLLDALVGNQDRHEKNWALIVHEGSLYLAPTFDHASSLGRNESDQRRAALLNDDGAMAAYVNRARSLIYGANQARLGTHQAFEECLKLAERGSSFWLGRLESIRDEQLQQTLDDVPPDWMNEVEKAFALRMLLLNRERLLRERVAK